MARVPEKMRPRWCEICGATRSIAIVTEYYNSDRYCMVLCTVCDTLLEEYGEQEGEY